jgi:hypothetical protein
MLDLCAGLGGASAAMRDRGWDVVTVDIEAGFRPDIVADLRSFRWEGPTPYLIWASPPCTEFSRESMPWCRTGAAPDMALVEACVRVVRECGPTWWVIENVRGATKWFRPLLGRFRLSCGPFFLWGDFPRFRCRVEPFKEMLSSTRKAERAKVPYELSEALARACESSLFSGVP